MGKPLPHTTVSTLFREIGTAIQKDIDLGTYKVPDAARTWPLATEPSSLPDLAAAIWEHLSILGVKVVYDHNEVNAEQLMSLYLARKEAANG